MSLRPGLAIADIRPMTNDELAAEGWDDSPYGAPPAIVFEDGTVVYPSRDEEGNGPGALFGINDGQQFYVHPTYRPADGG